MINTAITLLKYSMQDILSGPFSVQRETETFAGTFVVLSSPRTEILAGERTVQLVIKRRRLRDSDFPNLA